jgi:hypothetical protein
MFVCAAVLLAWRFAHINVVARAGSRWSGLDGFIDVFHHSIALLSLAGSLLLAFDPGMRWVGILVLAAVAATVMWFGWRRRLFSFVAYAVIAALIGLGQAVRSPTLMMLYFLLASISAIVVLFWAWRKLREAG